MPSRTQVLEAPAKNGRPSGRAAALASVAMAVPDQVVTNEAVAAGAGVTEQWIVHRTGVRERRHVRDGQRLEELAAEAGGRALEEAGVEAAELDLVLVATLAADELTPNAAPLVALRLGADRAGTMDVGAACTGYLSALALAAAQVESGRCDQVLVIGADLVSRFLDPTDRGTAALFADGAGATVVGPANGDQGRIGPIALHADGSGAPAIRAAHHDQIIHMQGHDTFKAAVQRLSESTLEAVDGAGLELDDVDLFVYHQANARILAAVAQRLDLDSERVIDCIDRYGNTSSATLPIAMADARERGMLEPGMNVLLAAFGAGFTWGAGVIQWGA
ncbi:MAG: 3-oxoacyl-ACP synthase III family protein [Thermoleophilaceae bacterium]